MTLSALSIGSLELTPSFSPDTLNYTVEWEHSTSDTYVVNATASDPGDTILVGAMYADSGVVDIDSPPPKTYDSNPPPKRVDITISNGTDSKTYKVQNSAIEE